MMSEQQSPFVGKPSRDAFGAVLVELARADERVVALTADLGTSVRLEAFMKEFPERVFNFGIAEQNMMGASAGLALGGKIPFVTTYAAFASMRATEQARTDVAYNELSVRICPSHGGFGLAAGGATHHALEDVSIFRTIANMRVIVPADGTQAAAATRAIAYVDGPVYMRLSRPAEPTVYTVEKPFEIGKADVVRQGKDLAIIAYGGSVGYSLKAAELLAGEGIQAGVVNMSTVKPIDRQAVIDAAQKSGAVMTVEEHNIIGGLGSAVAEVMAEEGLGVPLKRLGVLDVFTTAGPYNEMLAYYELDPACIAKNAREFLKGR